jgi:uncharacterized BrkB/YihY/UPF0761 family membrane protein
MRISAGSPSVALAFLESIADSTGLPLLLSLLLIFLLLLFVLAYMVNPNDPPKNFSTIQIVFTMVTMRQAKNIYIRSDMVHSIETEYCSGQERGQKDY